MGERWERDAWELAESVRAGDVSAVDLLDESLRRIERLDGELNAFVHLAPDEARAQAEAIDRRVAAGDDPGRFAGVPMGVKELAQVEGWPDTHASRLHADAIAPYDCTEVARLRAEGAVFVGLTASPEFGSTNWTRSFLHGTTRNPWNPERTPGGSSGGSAAAVSAGLTPICTGSDGGGSIRIPCAYTGLFGFKVSFGLIGSNTAFDTGLTSVSGPIARSVLDAARYVDVVAGPTTSDPTSLPKPSPPFEDRLRSGAAVERVRGLRVAWSSTLGFAVCDPEVERIAHDAALALIADAGWELVEVEVDFPRPGRAWSIVSMLDTATSSLEPARGRMHDLTPVPRAGFEMLERATIDEFVRANQRRNDLLLAIGRVFDEVDLLLTPTTATTAFVAEGPPPMEIAGQRVSGMGSVPYTAPFNISGQPAVSIPCGITSDGLPVGLQVVARRHQEEQVLAAGLIAETNRPWPKFAPLAAR
ncbi:MAG TPA: amidase family protein [Acidimicrobiia bacterium]|nr:amidase family protein [Acidimicrobiia bacterium]